MKKEEDFTGPVDLAVNRDVPNPRVVAKACTDEVPKLTASKARIAVAGQIIFLFIYYFSCQINVNNASRDRLCTDRAMGIEPSKAIHYTLSSCKKR